MESAGVQMQVGNESGQYRLDDDSRQKLIAYKLQALCI